MFYTKSLNPNPETVIFMHIPINESGKMNKTKSPRLSKKVNKEVRFQVRFDRMDIQKLEELSNRMNSSKGEVIRKLLAQA